MTYALPGICVTRCGLLMLICEPCRYIDSMWRRTSPDRFNVILCPHTFGGCCCCCGRGCRGLTAASRNIVIPFASIFSFAKFQSSRAWHRLPYAWNHHKHRVNENRRNICNLTNRAIVQCTVYSEFSQYSPRNNQGSLPCHHSTIKFDMRQIPPTIVTDIIFPIAIGHLLHFSCGSARWRRFCMKENYQSLLLSAKVWVGVVWRSHECT